MKNSGEQLVSRYERLRFRYWPLKFKLQFVMQSTLLLVLGFGQVYVSSSLNSAMLMNLIAGQILLHGALFLSMSRCFNKLVRIPLRTVGSDLRNIMQGNLDSDIDISGRDEMGRLLCEVQSMRTMVDEIAGPVAQIQTQIRDLDARVANVAENAITEQEQVRTIAATMEEFSVSVADVANMAVDSLQDVMATKALVEENNRNMELSITETGQVAETVLFSSKKIINVRTFN